MKSCGFIFVCMFGCLLDVMTNIKDISAKGSATYVLFFCNTMHYFTFQASSTCFKTYTNMLK